MDQQEIITTLIERIERLEKNLPRKRRNQQEAAARLGMGVSKFRDLRRQGHGPKGKLIGKIWSYDDKDLDDWEAGSAA